MTEKTDTKFRKPGFTAAIVVGLLMGLFCGLFFGEYTRWIKWMGDAFVGLLQMAILPYVAVSLIVNVGRLTSTSGARLLRVSVLVLAILWAVGLATLLIMMQAFPAWDTGSFFSSLFTEEPPAHNWLDLFIPSNPFRSLADNSIPAVVVFSIGIGIALTMIPNKEVFLDPLDVLVAALSKLNKLVVKLTPIGMFAIVAYATGTTDVVQFALIQGYLLTYCVTAIVLTFIVLPAMVSALTPLKFWDVLRVSYDPLIAAFVIGNSFVVLPMVIESIKQLEEKQMELDDPDDHAPEYLVPLAYPFPDVGRIVGLIFIPFAAWFYGNTIDLDRYPALMGVGLLGSFGKPVITIPLLLNLAEIPGDIFNLFLASGVIAARFGDLMKTMHLFAFTLLVSFALRGMMRLNWPKLIVQFAGSTILLLAAAFLIRGYLDANFKDYYSKEKLVTEREMEFPSTRPLSNINPSVLTESNPNPDPIQEGESRIDRIKRRGVIRIGFDSDKMPFSYFSASNQLIGFDIEMAYYLADDLKVNIEFVPMDRNDLESELRNDHFDLAMSAIEGTVGHAVELPSIVSYMDVTLAVVVPDYMKHNFRTPETILGTPDLKLAIVKNSFFADRAPKVIPDNVELVEIESASEYFEGIHTQVNGLVISAESGSAWTLRRPRFTVANPLKSRIKVPLYYLTSADTQFQVFLNNWLLLKRAEGTYQQLYDHWILGEDNQEKSPRWCVIRDVLGWVD
ncbi:MAG TPA: hypothetical protein DDW52_15050 [Planctomycetaceae bacterium]|nr:hypothetical protein [Planctomycetaceae bacterium]